MTEDNKFMISLYSHKIVKILSFIVLCLITFSIGSKIFRYYLNIKNFEGIERALDINQENSIPTWYATITLLICSLLLACITIVKKQKQDLWHRHWQGLSIIFCFLSLDEAASIHEIPVPTLRSLLNASGLFYYTWIIPAFFLIIILGFTYLKFIFALPHKTRFLFCISSLIFLFGSLGIEAIGGWYGELYTEYNFTYAIIATIEETLEKIGIIIFIYALLNYIASNIKSINIQIK